jgi:hypothetical protein
MNKPIVFLFCLAVGIVVSTKASAGGYGGYGDKNLGGVNLNYYCQKTFGSEFKSVLIGKTAGDWTCERNKTDRRSISVTNACKLQYGKQNLRSKALNWNDPLSWRCFEPRKPKHRG